MRCPRSIALVVAAVAGVVPILVASTSGGAAPTRTTVAEPVGAPVSDGEYLAYVRTQDLPGRTVEVDFVELVGGRVRNTHPPVRMDAGLLTLTDVFDDADRPLRITVRDGALVAAATADDLAATVDSTFRA